MTDPHAALADFRAYLAALPRACDALARIDDFDTFVAAALQVAHAGGITLPRDAIATASRGDMLGLDRFDPIPATQTEWPERGWLPAAIGTDGTAPIVRWRHFGGLPLGSPFFAEPLRRVEARGFNRLLPVRTPLSAFAAAMPPAEDRAPAGLVLHMSRCGSTLVAQMLAALPGISVLSEPAPFDALLQIALLAADVTFADRVAMVRAMAAALGRERFGVRERYVLKLDSWHALALPLLRAAFPDTPWIFLFRDPTEVMVAQMALRGTQTLPGAMDARIYGVAPHDAFALSEEAYCALVLAKVCDAALGARPLGGGLFLDYTGLPDSVETIILPHFGIAPDAAGLAALQRASSRNAKRPGIAFTRDGAAKQRDATDAIRAAVAHRLAAPWHRLQALAADRT